MMRTFSPCPNGTVAEHCPLLRLVESVGLTFIAAAVVIVALPTTVAAQETISLFNGEDLTGWTIHGTELWYVEDGELVCESGPDSAYGYLATEASYKDFELTLDFLQEADGNSGHTAADGSSSPSPVRKPRCAWGSGTLCTFAWSATG
jgi:hypothetical protein